MRRLLLLLSCPHRSPACRCFLHAVTYGLLSLYFNILTSCASDIPQVICICILNRDRGFTEKLVSKPSQQGSMIWYSLPDYCRYHYYRWHWSKDMGGRLQMRISSRLEHHEYGSGTLVAQHIISPSSLLQKVLIHTIAFLLLLYDARFDCCPVHFRDAKHHGNQRFPNQ